jgi:hypothetical protein
MPEFPGVPNESGVGGGRLCVASLGTSPLDLIFESVACSGLVRYLSSSGITRGLSFAAGVLALGLVKISLYASVDFDDVPILGRRSEGTGTDLLTPEKADLSVLGHEVAACC